MVGGSESGGALRRLGVRASKGAEGEGPPSAGLAVCASGSQSGRRIIVKRQANKKANKRSRGV